MTGSSLSRTDSAPAAMGRRVKNGAMDERVRGVRIAYDDTGSGPVVIRVHGLTGSRYQDDVTEAFTVGPFVRAGFRVVRYDVRGHGKSDGEPVVSDYVWANLAHDLLALLDALRIDRVSGVGAAMGTAILLHAVAAAPDRFDHLVLTCPPTAWDGRAPQRAIMRDAAQSVDDNGREAFETTRRAGKTPPALADQPLGPVDIDASLLSAVLRGAAESDLPSPDAIARIRTPTLVLAWDEDEGHPLSTATALCDLVSGSELHVARTPDELRTWEDLMVDFLKV
jgi:3-oxoadipate enol-lactonase